MDRKTIDEKFEDGLELNGKPVLRRLVGQYSEDWNTYTLREYWKVGDKEKQTGEWIIKNCQGELAFGFNPEQQAKEKMQASIAYRDEIELLKSLL